MASASRGPARVSQSTALPRAVKLPRRVAVTYVKAELWPQLLRTQEIVGVALKNCYLRPFRDEG